VRAGWPDGVTGRGSGRERSANGGVPNVVIALTVGAANLRGTHMTATPADMATGAREQLAGALRGER
jgi:hypothetical protein